MLKVKTYLTTDLVCLKKGFFSIRFCRRVYGGEAGLHYPAHHQQRGREALRGRRQPLRRRKELQVEKAEPCE